MGYKWATIDANFDRSLQFTKVRWDLSQSWSDGYFSELPNINCDNKGWTSITGAEWGYAGQYTMNLSSKKCFIRNQSTGTYGRYDMYDISTQVETNIYEYEYSVPLYWGGVSNSSLYNNGLGISVLVQSSTFEITPSAATATYESGSTTITVNTDNDDTITWTASTSDSWLSLSTTTGTGDGSVVVTYADNKAFQPRTGTVTFTGSNGDVLTFTIEQEKKPLIVYDRPIYRSGSLVKKMYLEGDLIYVRLNPPTPPVPPTCADSGLCGDYPDCYECSCEDEGLCGDYPDCYECTCEDQYEEGTQEKCECEGGYWYNDICNYVPQQTCEEQGLCGDDPNNCYDCDCEDRYEEGTQDLCECQGKYWYNDTCNDEPEPEPTCEEQGLCGDEPNNCYECGGEADCTNSDPYNWWDEEEQECHNCEEEWEDLGYSSPEECACDKRGEFCDEGE